jgi:hypothetical protein
LKDSGKTIFADKTPRYYHILEFIHSLFPKARMIWLKRNPLDVAASYVSTWKTPVAELTGEIISPFSFDLAYALKRFSQFFEKNVGHQVFYEELVKNPEVELDKLCRFLGIPAESGMKEYGSPRGPAQDLIKNTMGDRKVFNHKRPHTDSIGNWEKILTREDAAKIINSVGRELLIKLGYEELVGSLAEKGFTFPSQKVVNESMVALEDRARRYSAAQIQADLETLQSLENARVGLRTLQNARWTKLGRALKILPRI